jgi:hypothetical protein
LTSGAGLLMFPMPQGERAAYCGRSLGTNQAPTGISGAVVRFYHLRRPRSDGRRPVPGRAMLEGTAGRKGSAKRFDWVLFGW